MKSYLMNRMQQSKFHNVFRRMGQMKSLVPRSLVFGFKTTWEKGACHIKLF